MARIKLKQILSNLDYNKLTRILTVSGSNYPALVVTGSVQIIPDERTHSGSLNISGSDTFGDSGSFDSIDLGSF